MKKSLIIASAIIFSLSLSAQVTFIIESLPAYTPPEDSIYIAGDFQGWNPGDPDFALQKNEMDKWFIQLDTMPEGSSIEFKFTRGDWGKVEKGIMGEEIPNRQFTFGNGDTVYVIIYNWADIGGGNSTAAENVHIVEDVYMPQLDRYRRIWVYLPPDYYETDKHYPVIYMHDGQNLFDTYTSFAGEWQVDETLNDLFDEGYQVPIVIGIDNGGAERINEYTPWPNPNYGGGMGSLYIQFIVETLKPAIDDSMRTLPDRESTGLWGSSLGGLISHYGALKHQDVFGKAGIYSPSYWFSDSVWMFTQQMGHEYDMMLYQMTGSLEGGTMVEDTWKMNDTLASLGFGSDELLTKIIPGGQHNEALWASDFAEAYLWLFESYANGIRDFYSVKSLNVFPNPVVDRFMIQHEENISSGRIVIYNALGSIVLEREYKPNEQMELKNFDAGMYIIEITTPESLYRGKIIKR